MAYVSGNPIMSDEEFDELKMKLKVSRHLYSLNNLPLKRIKRKKGT